MTSPNDFNQAIISEFRANGGAVGGMFAGRPLLLLHTTGAKSGKPRISPLAFVTHDDQIVVIASKGGSDENPDWYYNLKANPEVTVELGSEQFQGRAQIVLEEPERSQIYAKMVAIMPGFAEYEQKTTRKIPVVLISRSA